MSIDKLHMEPLDGEFETTEIKNKAKRNAQQMSSTVMKLVHFFRDEVMQNKLQREFRPQANEIAQFSSTYAQMRELWMIRLSTSLEETIRMQEQVETSGKRVKDLTKTLEDKMD